MKRIKVYYEKSGERKWVIVTAETGPDAQDYVYDEYGPCKIIGLEYLD